MRPDWDSYFLALADTVSTRADCVRRKVGAVIVDPHHRILSTGYNGAPSGKPGCLTAGACPRGRSVVPSYTDYSNCIAVHAEANALLYVNGWHTRGATLYTTDMPCLSCQKLIEGAGIARVVWPSGQWPDPESAVG